MKGWKMAENEYKEFADKFFELVSASDYARPNEKLVEAIVSKWLSEHRTIQQGFGRTLKNIVDQFAVLSIGSDLRNEATIEWAENSKDFGNGGFFPYI